MDRTTSEHPAVTRERRRAGNSPARRQARRPAGDPAVPRRLARPERSGRRESGSGPLFRLGRLVATPGALAALEEAGQGAALFLFRHLRLDPGELDGHDRQANRRALKSGARIFSAYRTSADEKLWIITEAEGEDGHRYSTCVLLPSEY